MYIFLRSDYLKINFDDYRAKNKILGGFILSTMDYLEDNVEGP